MSDISDIVGRINELRPEILAIHALNPFTPNNAPARGAMMSSHFSQRLPFDCSEPNIIQTGIEAEFGKYSLSVKMPEDGTILRVIPKYRQGVSGESINFNPETLVLYRSHETGEVGHFIIPYHISNHPQFGFKCDIKPVVNELTPGRSFEKDTIFADTPAVKEDGVYTFGVNLNVVYMSHPNVGLDGYVINRDALPKLKYRVYETRSASLGPNDIPINLYGTVDDPKAFPDIGEYITDDGLLLVSRKIDPLLAPALLSKEDLMRVDVLFDNKIYAQSGKGKIVDITVIRSENVNRQLPAELTRQLEKYSKANERYNTEIIKAEEQLIQESHASGKEGRINITKPLQRLLVMAKGVTNYHGGRHRQPLRLTYKREPLDTWKITFTIEYEVVPDRGFKLSCLNGGGPKI